MSAGIESRVLRRGQDGYEPARQAATWHAGIRATYDPDSLFVSWLGRPSPE